MGEAPDSKTKILDAAETVFSECGYDGASLRSIVKLAGVNLATVYYHFRSKEELLQAVFQRRLAPLKEAQLRLLESAVQAHAPGPVPVETILRVLLEPALRLVSTREEAEQQKARRLVGRVVSEPSEWLQEMIITQYRDVREAFVTAFRRALPHLPLKDLYWRLELVWGGLATVLCNPCRIQRASGGLCDGRDTETALAEMIAFYAAGMRAPAVTDTGETPRPDPAP